MSEVIRRGKAIRPYWDHQVTPGLSGYDRIAVEMLESVRNVNEQILSELRSLNHLLNCPNFMSIPDRLRRISANTYAAKHGRNGAVKK